MKNYAEEDIDKRENIISVYRFIFVSCISFQDKVKKKKKNETAVIYRSDTVFQFLELYKNELLKSTCYNSAIDI